MRRPSRLPVTKRARRGCGSGCGCLVLLLLIAAIVFYIFRVSVLTALGSYLVLDQPPVKADAVVVLGGDEFGMRTVKAAQLVQAGYAPYALLSGPQLLLIHESELTLAFALKQGYPASLFQQYLNDANSTREEETRLAQELQRRGAHRILLVTSNYHTRRATYLFHRVAPWLLVQTVAAPDAYFTPDSWWKTRRGRKTFALEWLKTVATWLGQ
ncbi:MAG: YdcF family protein [Bryobacteraceae bacterium]